MNKGHSLLKAFGAISLLLLLVVSESADAGLFGFGGDSWKEEVLLHDGQKIIVKRSQSYGGRHEIGQPPPIKEHTITFTLPGSNKAITWTSEYGEDLGRTNFNLLAVHTLNGTPYIVAEPNLSLSYNKWGRPNPPYVFFKYDGKEWHRIPLEEFPSEFKTINVALTLGGRDVEAMVSLGVVSSENIKERNSHLTQPEYKTIIRTPLDAWKSRPPGSNSGRMVRTADGWMGMDWFEDQPSLEACLKLCEQKKISSQNCPCNSLFNGK
ncbi:hypothetical protein [Sulfurirhabdus autotrophica]|uniref:Uncharacterized protein n=1 Tax=Sulfurirhabdus autotrophica TaxID=1706046 RepID=A0A4R3Y1Y5_9PROT|nr:hypothetical protein [Sulfurirhabdus autotrophica]TCV84708.1 hypothetical protein EDC63_11152 [Sulfurirhabdus autotrophica]